MSWLVQLLFLGRLQIRGPKNWTHGLSQSLVTCHVPSVPVGLRASTQIPAQTPLSSSLSLLRKKQIYCLLEGDAAQLSDDFPQPWLPFTPTSHPHQYFLPQKSLSVRNMVVTQLGLCSQQKCHVCCDSASLPLIKHKRTKDINFLLNAYVHILHKQKKSYLLKC